MTNSERATLEAMRKLQFEADQFWKLSGFIGAIRQLRNDDTAAFDELQQQLLEMENEVYEHRCQRSTIDEMKERYRNLMHLSRIRDMHNDYQSRELAAIRTELANRGVDENWYIDEG